MFYPASKVYFSVRQLWLPMLLLAAATAQAQTYATGFNDSHWAVQAGPFACGLSHKIPAFGTAYFGHKAGVGGFFEFRSTSQTFPAGAIAVDAMPPAWRSDLAPQRLLVLPEAKALNLTSAQQAALTSSLKLGTNVVFSGVGINERGNSFRVILDARNFAAAHASYQRCVSNLIPYTFKGLSSTVLYYAADAETLSAAAKSQLDKIVRFTKAEPRVLGILVDAHSDKYELPETGEFASRLQAELVTDYLIDRGVSPERITTRWHGDRFPIAPNENKAGQAKNRRITLRLEDAASRKELERKVAVLKAAEEKAAAAQLEAAKASANSGQENLTINKLEQMVEQQDLTSGKQPRLN